MEDMSVRRFQHASGFPPDETTSCSVGTNSIKNSHITRRDEAFAKEMLGPSKYEMQGKTARSKSDAVDITS